MGTKLVTMSQTISSYGEELSKQTNIPMKATMMPLRRSTIQAGVVEEDAMMQMNVPLKLRNYGAQRIRLKHPITNAQMNDITRQ